MSLKIDLYIKAYIIVELNSSEYKHIIALYKRAGFHTVRGGDIQPLTRVLPPRFQTKLIPTCNKISLTSLLGARCYQKQLQRA